MTATIAPTATTATVSTAGLRDALRAVIPGASTDKTLPVLNAVQVTLTHDAVTLHSTDRYVLMEYTITVPEGDRTIDADAAPVAFTLTLDDAKSIVKATPARPAEWLRAVPTVTEGATQYDPKVMTVALTGGATFTFRAAEGEFPAARRLFPDNTEPKIDGLLGLGHKQLGQIMTASKHLDKNAALVFAAGPEAHKPVVVTVEHNDAWRGLIMPRRLSAQY